MSKQWHTFATNKLSVSIGGSVVECSPATRAARVRFPANATFYVLHEIKENHKIFSCFSRTDYVFLQTQIKPF